ncbi:ATP-dependent DNA helicase mph1 [Verticillium dahliae]
MDSDDYDDDIADEDLAEAFSQSDRAVGSSASRENSNTMSSSRSLSTTHPSTINTARAPNYQDGMKASEMDELLAAAFSSSPELEPVVAVPPRAPRQPFGRTSSNGFRQTTLFGGTVHDEEDADSRPIQPGFGRVYRADKPVEATHHELNNEALKTWVYPKNLGAVRDYQYSIVKNGLFNNTLVALPTGLGKTFIAATVMLNFHRWTKTAKIVFVAPTKPLVAQQVDACFNIVGISRLETTMLTGDVAPAIRVDEWQAKRVFFMTPQTLLNDISRGYADPKSIVLLVVDEAHRSTGEYAYAKVVKQMRRFNPYFRVLALTATPGSKVETVQEVIDNLGISHTEIRTEDSIDIRQYVHQRNIDQRIIDPSYEMCEVKDLFTKALKPMMDKLTKQNIYYGRDPMAITTFGLMKQEQDWMKSAGRHVPQPLQHMMRAIFAILKSLAHSIKLLNFHGIKPFFDNLKDFRSDVEEKGQKGSKYKKQLVADPSFQEMMQKVEGWLRIPSFVGHPKLAELAETMLNHFMDAKEGSATRAIVFSEYRDSAEEIVRALSIHKPLIKPTVFVGQAEGKRSAGMKQAQQIETVEKFRTGEYNVLVATSIGEEGLDIGQVDLIVCYDASSSPIRMLQRMGRTGRKREGNVVLLLMRGKEEESFSRARENYEAMQALICEGSKFNFRHDLSARIVPREIRPEVDMQQIEIPIENTQNTALPEPGRRKAGAAKKKMPPKKFHMPDGVETGFVTASRVGLLDGSVSKGPKKKTPKKTTPAAPCELDQLADIPPLDSVLLSTRQMAELDRNYRTLPFNRSQVEEIEVVDINAHPALNRRLRPVGKVQHGARTKKYVELMQTWAKKYKDPAKKWHRPYGDQDTSRWEDIPFPPFAPDTDDERPPKATKKRQSASLGLDDHGPDIAPRAKKRKSNGPATKAPLHILSDAEEGDDSENTVCEAPQRGRPKKAAVPKVRGRKPKKRAPQKRGGINSDELGDDCDRDSDMEDTDGSDDGADLLDFVVGDDHPISSLRDVSDDLPSSATSTPVPTRTQLKPFFEPLSLPATQDSTDDLPDLSVMTARTGLATKTARRGKPTVVDDSDASENMNDVGNEFDEVDDDDLQPRGQSSRHNRRRTVIDESDEDSY